MNINGSGIIRVLPDGSGFVIITQSPRDQDPINRVAMVRGVEGEGGELGSARMAYQTPKGRVIPRQSLCDNDLRQLSHRTVTNRLFSGPFGVRVVAASASANLPQPDAEER